MQAVIGPWQISIERAWPSGRQLAHMYDSAAPTWHRRLRRLGVPDAYARLMRGLAAGGTLAHLRPGSAVLDCGIGTGAFSLALAGAATHTPVIFGVDLSQKMVDEAAQQLACAGLSAEIRRGSVRRLPYPDGTFDAVLSAHMLEHLPDPAAAVREMVRVFRPGSPLLLAVTRPGLPGMLLQWRWKNSALAPAQVEDILRGTGVGRVRRLAFAGGISRWSSAACVGVKL